MFRAITRGSLIALLAGLASCAGAPVAAPAQNVLNVRFYSDDTDQCGPSTLAGVLSFWGKTTDVAELKREMYFGKLHGTLPMDLLLAAQAHGLKAEMIRGDLGRLHDEFNAGRPVIVMLNQSLVSVPIDHYVVVTGFDEARQGLYAHSGRTPHRFIPYKTFLRQWEKTDYWALVSRPAS